MHPLLLVAIGIGIGKLLIELFSGDKELSEIDHKHIYKDYLIDQDKEAFDTPILKGKITRAINRIERGSKAFKIGKTGHPKNRKVTHGKYDRMFLLCSSSQSELINELESYYTGKYIDHPKNQNQKVGSAGEAKDTNGQYFLYVVVQLET